MQTLPTYYEETLAFVNPIAERFKSALAVNDCDALLDIVKSLEERVVLMNDLLSMATASNERWAKESRTKQSAVQACVDVMVDMFEGDTLPGAIETLAEAFDIDLSEEFNATVTVTYSVSGTRPRGMSDREVAGLLDMDVRSDVISSVNSVTVDYSNFVDMEVNLD